MSLKTNARTIYAALGIGASGPERTRLLVMISLPVILTLPLLGSTAFTQQTAQERVERFRSMSVSAETKGLAEPFKGITTNGQVAPGLFAIHSTGVSTASLLMG